MISDNQFGFRKSRNTIDVINEFMCSAYESINQRTCLISLYLNFSKAFGTIYHSILLDKLEHMGIRGIAGKWYLFQMFNMKANEFPRQYLSSIIETNFRPFDLKTGLARFFWQSFV